MGFTIRLKVVGAINFSLGVTFRANRYDPPSTGLVVAIGLTVEKSKRGPAIITMIPIMNEAPKMIFIMKDYFSPLGWAI